MNPILLHLQDIENMAVALDNDRYLASLAPEGTVSKAEADDYFAAVDYARIAVAGYKDLVMFYCDPSLGDMYLPTVSRLTLYLAHVATTQAIEATGRELWPIERFVNVLIFEPGA